MMEKVEKLELVLLTCESGECVVNRRNVQSHAGCRLEVVYNARGSLQREGGLGPLAAGGLLRSVPVLRSISGLELPSVPVSFLLLSANYQIAQDLPYLVSWPCHASILAA